MLIHIIAETISVLRSDGKFRCPLVGCLKTYSSADTFATHMKGHSKCESITVARSDDECVTEENKIIKSLKRRKLATDIDTFTSGHGSQKALKLNTERQASQMADALDCEPVAIHLSHDSMTNPHSIYGVFHVNDVHDTQMKLPCESASFSSPVTCVLQFQSEKHTVMAADIITTEADDAIKLLKQAVHKSTVPKLLEKNGDYTEPSKDLLDFLNFEFGANPSLLNAVAKLHTGSFIVDKEVVFVIVAETYSRSKATDIHGESDQKSVPTVSDSRYGSLCAGVYNESDGGSLKRKLKIGSTTMNILVTMSVRVSAEASVDIGPETTMTSYLVRSKAARIFYRVDEVHQFLETMRDPWSYAIPISAMKMSSLRQLTSSFGSPSTFLPWRAAHNEFSTELTVPTTVFTLCSTPHNQGYGASSTSVGKLASRFLQSLATSVLFRKPGTDFGTALEAFETTAAAKALQEKGNSPPKSWDILSSFVSSLKAVLDKNNELSPSVLATILNFSSLSDLASQNIASSNQRIKDDILLRLKQLYRD
jgi:hypothetical protein